MSWLVNIVNREAPVRRAATPAVQARKDALLALWSAHITPAAEGGAGDYEDFYEQAVRLEAALDAFGPGNIWLTVSTDTDGAARNIGTGERRLVSDLGHLPRYGTQASRRHEDVDMEQARLAAAYYRYDAFRSRAGRRVALCGFGMEDETAAELGDVLAGWAADGIRRAFLKSARVKYAAFPVGLPEGFRPEDGAKAVFDELDYGAMGLEGQRDSLIAQEFVAMEYEYRVFVVGHRAVSGAGCIEEFTPLDNNGYAFDNKLRRNRSEKSEVELAPEIAGMLTGFARRAIDALTLEVPELTEYVIDVAMAPDGQPLIVELNSLLNSGLYASRPGLVTKDMAACASYREGTRPRANA